ncbi:hypothetical protein [Bradyrhizobium genosp. SA-3]|uniref:hypothetical protein n=1 Tax=Bradyrhizobium genosp. SA-3 TaxID=508868 RepID=UPI001028EFFC|nr:hypothetical protein [Bradyrhizobium genosp. SA-3]
MTSLTSLLPTLAPLLGLTEQALYERQRALVRMSLLPAPKGRGRGSGAEATPDTVARLLTAVLATDNLSDTDERVQRLAFAPFVGKKGDRCPWTGARTFVEALSFLLSEQAAIPPAPKLDGHTSIHVYRREPRAMIVFGWKRRPGKGTCEFGHRDRSGAVALLVDAQLTFEGIQIIRQLLLPEAAAE